MHRTDSRSRTSVFPRTEYTWIEDRLAAGQTGVAEVRRHLMEMYAKPLSIYIKGSTFRTVGDPDELVAGFFASRLSRPSYIDDWRESGRPLRKWIITGLRHFLFEQIKAARKDAALYAFDERLDAPQGDDDATRAYERAVARQLVEQALRQTEADLIQDGLELHWRVFWLHMVQGMSYQAMEQQLAITPSRLAALCRTATRRFRVVVRRLVSWPGAEQSEIELDLSALRECIAGSPQRAAQP